MLLFLHPLVVNLIHKRTVLSDSAEQLRVAFRCVPDKLLEYFDTRSYPNFVPHRRRTHLDISESHNFEY
jgi:hypothetical protein